MASGVDPAYLLAEPEFTEELIDVIRDENKRRAARG